MDNTYKGYYIDKNGDKKILYSEKNHFPLILELLDLEQGNIEDIDYYIYELLSTKDYKFLLLDVSLIPRLGCMAYFKEGNIETAKENVFELEEYNLSEIYMFYSQDRKEQIDIDSLKEMESGKHGI